MTFLRIISFTISEAVRFITPTGLALQWLLLGFGLTLAFLLPKSVSSPLAYCARLIRRLAARPILSIALCCLLPIALRLAILPVAPVPDPSVHDEFSHLLIADTFTHGRLTNPTPKDWRHFESIHIIQNPTYTSMYPPGQGVFLALGQIVFREPWVGVLIAVAAMCGAMYWMFMAWLPARWALYGALLAVFQLALVGFWVNGYISAAVPALGGALVTGALPRLRRDIKQPRYAMALGLGSVILLYTRPFEGGLLTLVVCLALLPSLVRAWHVSPKLVFSRAIGPAALILAIGTAWLGYYCYRVTGHVTRMPYQVNRSTYGWPENLAILKPRKVNVQNAVLRHMYEAELAHRDIYKSTAAFVNNFVTRLFDNWAFFVGPILTLPLLFGLLRPGRGGRTLLALLGTAVVANLAQMLLYPYHLAPVVPVVFCLMAVGVKNIYDRLRSFGNHRQMYVAAFIPAAVLLSMSLRQWGEWADVPPSSYWERGYEWHRDARADIVRWLSQRPGKHLVMVRYSPTHPINQEWVYNDADVRATQILWARELDCASNQSLMHDYADRDVWLVQADDYPQHVVPYSKEEN